MKKNFLIILSAAVFLVSCASTHSGSEASTSSNAKLPLKVSAQTIEESAEDSFQLIDVTIENTSATWVKIHSSEMVIYDVSRSPISVVMGSDLQNWAQAMEMRLAKEKQNKEMLQLGLVTASAVAIIAAGGKTDGNLLGAGAAVMAGTYAWALTDALRYSYRNATESKKVPELHLYNPFSVPGKMFVRRWLLVNKPVGTLIDKLVLEFETVEGEKGIYEISL